MDTARYVFAVIVVCFGVPSVLFWVVIHPFAHRWRRIGFLPAWSIVGGAMIATIVAMVLHRDLFVGRDLGWRLPLAITALVLIAPSLVLRVAVGRQLTGRALMGGPELTAGEPGELLTEGVYARIRHPRYAQLFLTMLAYTLFANYVGAYIMTALFSGLIYVVVLLEEVELKQRFGEAYREYARRVPRFLPRL